MTIRQYEECCIRAGVIPPAGSAFRPEYIRNTRKKSVDSIIFRSTLEADAYQLLKSWRDAGAITSLELQPRFVLQEAFVRDGKKIQAMTYRADFAFVREGRKWVIEAKGFRTEPYRMRRKLFLCRYPSVVFEEWTRETLRRL